MVNKYSPKIVEENFNVSKKKPLAEFFKLLVVVVLVVVAFYFILGFAVNLFVPYLPDSFDNSLSGLYKCEKSKHKSEKRAKKIFTKLINNLDKKNKKINYTLCIIDDSDINAFAAPGGYIGLNSGLLDEVDSDNELAFVLAHELGHISNRDHLKKLGRSLLNLIFISFFMSENSVGIINSINQNTENSFSRTQEKNSDIFALKLLLKIYGNADGAITFMKRVDKLIEGKSFLYYLSSHPMPKDRINYIKKYLK